MKGAGIPDFGEVHLDKNKLRAFVLADNQLALKSGWDTQILGEELSELIEFDLDLSVTGFDWPEIEHLNENETEPDPIDRVPAVPKAAITRLGDIWNIGRHRLICGDSTKPETFQACWASVKRARCSASRRSRLSYLATND